MTPHVCNSPVEVPDIPLGHGSAIDSYATIDEEGWFVVGNGEYASRVAFCPWCGAGCPATTTPKEKEQPPEKILWSQVAEDILRDYGKTPAEMLNRPIK